VGLRVDIVVCNEEFSMELYDQHLHSRHSFDSQADPRANVVAAVRRGLAGLTFTEHFDVHPSDWPTCVYDDDAYGETIAGLRREFGDALFIGKGIEVCYQPRQMDRIVRFLEEHSFDLVILSVHYFGTSALHRREHWEGVDAATGTRRYLAHVADAVRCVRDLQSGRDRVFDVLGHLDLVKRYTHRFLGECKVDACRDLIGEILENCVASGITPEINTSTLRQGLCETSPNQSTVRDYAKLGGDAMSLGSDAHESSAVGTGFDEALSMLRDAGLRNVAVFESRKRRLVPIGV